MALTFSVPDTELTLTLQNRMAEIVDNIFRGTPFLNAMRQHGGVETVDGGSQLVVPLMFSKNTTAGSFSGFDILDTTPQDNDTSAVFDWTSEYATISIAWDQEMKNQGRGKLIDISNQKADEAGMAIRDVLNVQGLATQPGAGSKDVNSITELIDNDPTANPPRTAAIGAISNANTWWRNQATNGGSFAVADMNTMYNTVSDGADPPTFMLTSQTVFEYYENSQTGLVRYGDTRSADLGFQNLLYKGRPIYWDPQIGITTEMYFI